MNIWLVEFDFPATGGMYDSLRFVRADTQEAALAVLEKDESTKGCRLVEITNLVEESERFRNNACFLVRDYIE